jgi:hypothetical protein
MSRTAFAAAYARITRHADGTLTVRGFAGRTYRTIQGAKAAARWIEATERRAKAAWMAAHGTKRQRALVATAKLLRPVEAPIAASEDFDGALDFGMVA